jgi:hypothetical protein
MVAEKVRYNLVDEYLITFIHKGGFNIVKDRVNIL